MDRRKLIVRRFGVLSFGLGYFEDGVWIDHLTAPDATDDDGVAEIHALFGCCSGAQSGVTAFAIAAAATAPTSRDEPAAAQGRSASS